MNRIHIIDIFWNKRRKIRAKKLNLEEVYQSEDKLTRDEAFAAEYGVFRTKGYL